MAHVQIYAMGLCACSACAPTDMEPAAVAEEVNAKRPTGIESRWQISPAPTFRQGQSNPCPCEHNPARRHWLLEC